MDVSVVMPAYNAEENIVNSIESVINQTFKNFELIIVDDGSKDNTLKICREYENKYPNIKVIHQKNGGEAAARNTGIKNASGKYIMFLDSDDTYKPDMVSRMFEKAENETPDWVLCAFSTIADKKVKTIKLQNTRNLNTHKEVLQGLYPFVEINGLINTWNKIYSRRIITENKIEFLPEFEMGVDHIFNLNYIEHCSNCGFIDEPLYNYYIQNSFLSNKYKLYEFEQRLKRLEIVKKLYLSNNMDTSPLNWQYIKGAYAHFFMLFHKDCGLNFSKKTEEVRKVLKNEMVISGIKNITPQGAMQKSLTAVIKTGNPAIILCFSYIVNYVHRILRKRK